MGAEMNWFMPDIPRFFTAIAEWLACMQCIMEVKRRFHGWRLCGISAGILAVQIMFMELTGELEGLWWMVCMAVAVGLMYGFLYLCCDLKGRTIGYYCVRAFVLAEFMASLEWQIDCYFYNALGWHHRAFRFFWLVLVYALVWLITWHMNKKYAVSEENLDITNKELLSYIIIGVAIFLVSNLGFASINTPFSGRYTTEIFNVRTIVDLGGLAILFAYHVQRVDFRMRRELELTQNILHNQYIQYKQSQEAMDIINYKYHDLKHHIIALRAEENTEKRNEYLDKMEEEIKNYEAQNKTGNKVLDTLLTSKNLYCLKNNISLTCVVDGTLFDFMDVMDICSIFGNALDNAIECEKKIPEKEKRLIHVSAFSQKSFLIIRFENYYDGDLVFDENLPVTTKKKPEFHGYGLKSLRYTVHKYGGEADVSVQDNWFNLKILIPM